MADQKPKTAGEEADEVRLNREKLMLRKEELELKRVTKQVAEEEAQDAYKGRQQRLRQANTQNQVRAAKKLTSLCSHRQGGQNGDMYKGKGPTALKIEKHPDGFTWQIRCLACPLKVVSPIPSNASKKLKKGELPDERAARLLKFDEDKALFDKYYAISQEEALTNDASSPMECGTTFKVTDEDGNQIYKPRPSDGYAMHSAVA